MVLNGVDITSSTSAPLYVKSAKTAALVLEDGSVNLLADGASRPGAASGSDEPNAALYSVVDFSIGGNGSLVVDARYNDGIASKDDLDITSGNIAVTSVADGIRGRDSLPGVDGGTIAVNAGKDGLKSSNDEAPEKGVVAVSAGTIAIVAGGGSAAGAVSADVSAKGIKGTVDVTIDGGRSPSTPLMMPSIRTAAWPSTAGRSFWPPPMTVSTRTPRWISRAETSPSPTPMKASRAPASPSPTVASASIRVTTA